jgi:hypothetical protein
MAIRRGEVPMEELCEMAETYMGLAENLIKEMPQYEVNKDAENIFDNFSRAILMKKFEV